MTTGSLYEIHDRRFVNLIVGSARLEELYSGCRWAEGPVWFNDANQLLWSDIPNQRMRAVDARRRRFRLSPAVQLQQRPHARPPGPPGLLRAWHAPRDAHRRSTVR